MPFLDLAWNLIKPRLDPMGEGNVLGKQLTGLGNIFPPWEGVYERMCKALPGRDGGD